MAIKVYNLKQLYSFWVVSLSGALKDFSGLRIVYLALISDFCIVQVRSEM